IENANINFLLNEEFDEKFLYIDVKAVNLNTNNEPTIEQFFNVEIFEQNPNITKEFLTVSSQKSTVANED
ncbi:27603_t:CDS:1, partial [Dentiscutata erythropus]